MHYTIYAATNKGADQTAQMHRLICGFVVRIWHKADFLMMWLKYYDPRWRGESNEYPQQMSWRGDSKEYPKHIEDLTQVVFSYEIYETSLWQVS